MKYTEEEICKIEENIVELLKEKEEMRYGKIAKVLIHKGLVNSSFEVQTILKNSDKFISPKTGVWKLA